VAHPGDDGGLGPLVDGDSFGPGDRAAPDRRGVIGDGLEDRAEPYWDQPTIRVPVGLAWSPEGLYVSSHGKVSFLRDDNGDGKADREEVSPPAGPRPRCPPATWTPWA